MDMKDFLSFLTEPVKSKENSRLQVQKKQQVSSHIVKLLKSLHRNGSYYVFTKTQKAINWTKSQNMYLL